MSAKRFYDYCARHGEYLPTIEDSWTGPFGGPDEDEDWTPRPAWVTDDLIREGFDEEDPGGCTFVRLLCTPEELQQRTHALHAQVMCEPTGDDDRYDYWPSGCLLFLAMCADCPDQADAEAMKAALVAEIRSFDEGGEMLERLGLE